MSPATLAARLLPVSGSQWSSGGPVLPGLYVPVVKLMLA